MRRALRMQVETWVERRTHRYTNYCGRPLGRKRGVCVKSSHRHRAAPFGAALAGGVIVSLIALTGIGSARTQAAPINTGQPTISGEARVGSTLTATQGSWSNEPTSFAYQWVRCPASGGASDGSDCAVIGGATTQAYVVSGADSGARLRVRVTASNADGSATAASNATELVPAQAEAPRATGEPAITGTARVGSGLTASQGSWSNNPTAFAYQWVRCPASGGASDGSDCAVIPGATTQVYTVSQTDVGRRLRVRVTASNSAGSATAASNATGIVPEAAASPAATGCPAGSGRILIEQLQAPARLSVAGQQMIPPVARRSASLVTVRFRVTSCGGRPVQGALVYVAAVPYNQFSVPTEQATGADGWATLTLRRLRGYPASRQQQLLVAFVRARKANENPLGGVSTRRLVSFPVSLRR